MKEKILLYFKIKTVPIRHRIVKLIAPRLYEIYLSKVLEDVDFPRPMIREVYKKFDDKPLIGVEIGVAYGLNAKSILYLLNMKMLYLIDPYEPYFEDGKMVPISSHHYEILKENILKKYKNVKLIKKKSEDAVNDVPDNLDFVYIDGNHQYEYVKKDIELYYPKVKKGGFIGGHDIDWKGVNKAVKEFVEKNNLKVNIKPPDWWIVKEK